MLGYPEASSSKAKRMKTLEYKVKKVLLDMRVDFYKPLAIAFSGGLDSSVLLSILVRIIGHENIRAIHVCHNIRPKEELEKEKIILQKTCRDMNIPLTIVNIRQGAISEYAHRTKCGVEAAARQYRYHALIRTAQRFGISTIATAHQADDQAETFFLRLLRGGRLEALGGILQSRLVDTTKDIYIIRPLLSFRRYELEAFARENSLEWSEDSTNRDNSFLRNRIRHELIPLLDTRFPSWRSSIESYQLQAQELTSLVTSIARQRMPTMVRGRGKDAILDQTLFKKEEALVRREILRLFLMQLGLEDIVNQGVLRSLEHAILKRAPRIEAGRCQFDLSCGVVKYIGKADSSSAFLDRSISHLKDLWKLDEFFLKVREPGQYECGPFRIVVSQSKYDPSSNIAAIDKEDFIYLSIPLSFPFVFRNRKEGETISHGTFSKDLDAIFKKQKISSESKHIITILEDEYGIAAILLMTFDGKLNIKSYYPPQLLCEKRKIMYILLLMKGDF